MEQNGAQKGQLTFDKITKAVWFRKGKLFKKFAPFTKLTQNEP